MEPQREWYTTDEAAEYLGVSKRTVYRLCEDGRLATYLLGNERTRRFKKADLDQAPRALNKAGNRSKGKGFYLANNPVLADLWDIDKDAVHDEASEEDGTGPMAERTAGITVDPNIHFGQPCVVGTRIPVYVVLECVEAGIPFDEIIREHYPDLAKDDIRACIRYAIDLIQEEKIRLVPAWS